MAKVDIAKEIVENHSEEEVLSWMESTLKNIIHIFNSNVSDDPAYTLGSVEQDLVLVYGTLQNLNEKRNPKPPVVAG